MVNLFWALAQLSLASPELCESVLAELSLQLDHLNMRDITMLVFTLCKVRGNCSSPGPQLPRAAAEVRNSLLACRIAIAATQYRQVFIPLQPLCAHASLVRPVGLFCSVCDEDCHDED